MLGTLTSGIAAVIVPSSATPCALESSARAATIPATTAISDAGSRGATACRTRISASDAEPEHDRPAGNAAEVGEHVPGDLEEVPGAAGDAEQRRDLARQDHEREPDHVSGQHRLGEELRDEAEARESRRARAGHP